MILLLFKSVLVWLVLVALAVANGVFRDLYLTPRVGAYRAVPLSGLNLSVLIFLTACLALPWFQSRDTKDLLLVGLVWLLLTVVFEFTFGLLVSRASWRTLLEAYTFKGGNLWPIVLLTTFLSPLLAARLLFTP